MSSSFGTRALSVIGLLLGLSASLPGSAHGIQCYRCISTNSSRPFLCNEFLTDEHLESLVSVSCDDVYGAKYCIKHVGRFEVLTLDCYQCTSADDWMCGSSPQVTTHLQPINCNHVFEARYCIQTFGRFGGGIGTKRFCSSVNLGNYCDYVQQPGDKLTYRTCVYTCDTDGCNPASTTSPSRLIIILQISSILAIFGFFYGLR